MRARVLVAIFFAWYLGSSPASAGFQDGVEAYMKVVEEAADLDAAVVAGQGWLDANLESYTANCVLLKEVRQDLKRSKMGRGIKTPYDEYMARLQKKADNPMLSAPLLQQFSSFFNCDTLLP